MYAPTPKPDRDGDAAAMFRDVDGSVSGSAGRMIVADNPFLLDGSCRRVAEWNTHVCNAGRASVRVASLDGAATPIQLRRTDGVTQSLAGTGGSRTEAQVSVFADEQYDVTFAGATPSRMSYVLRNGKQHWVQFSVAYPRAPKVTRYGCDVDDPKQYCYGGKPGSLAKLASAKTSTYFYDAAAQRLYLRITAKDGDYEELQVQPS
jgi:hypothetical protein